MDLVCITRCGISAPTTPGATRPRHSIALLIAGILLFFAGSEVRAQNPGDFTMALDRYDRAIDQAVKLARRLEETTCITAIAFPELQKEADAILASMNKADRDATRSIPFRGDSTPPDPVYAKQLTFMENDDDRANDAEADINQELYRLKHNPCPPEQIFSHAPLPKQTSYSSAGALGTGLSLGTYVIGLNRADQTSIETDRATDVQSIIHAKGDPPGVGFVATYLFAPWNNALRVGPFASFDILRQTVNNNFAGGQFLGTTTHWLTTTGLKAGAIVTPDLFIYGLTGASWLNEDLNIHFATAASSNVTIPGVTLGLGAEYQPMSWQIGGHPVTLFAQYQHSWWSTANFNAPASSPGFNYAFKREDDTVKFGVNFYFGAAPPAPPSSPTYPVKALVSK
jgi:hypothetical protein